MDQRQLNLGIITSPKGEAATTPLSNLAGILNGLSNELHVITGGSVRISQKEGFRKIHIHKINYNIYSNTMIKVINHISMQVRFSCIIIKLVRKVDVWVFFLDGHTLLLPLLTARLLGKKAVFVLAASIMMWAKIHKGTVAKMSVLSENIGFKFADKVILYSENLVQQWNLEEHKGKVSVAHEHFVDFTYFTIRHNVDERRDVVGFVGRFSTEKGIFNLVQAILQVLKERKDVYFIFCGEGEVFDEVRDIIRNEGLEAHVKLTGWISHNEVPGYLNELKLLIVPSYTEGLPNIVLEAMGSGTPVLATPVGAIPGVIRDGETGFLLRSNDPKHVADKIVELLSKPELLEKVSKNAYEWIRENFSLEKTLESWRRILQELQTR